MTECDPERSDHPTNGPFPACGLQTTCTAPTAAPNSGSADRLQIPKETLIPKRDGRKTSTNSLAPPPVATSPSLNDVHACPERRPDLDPDEGDGGDPPDGGWGWVVVFGSALAFFLGGGVSRSFTLIYGELLEIFHDNAAATSATAAIFGAVKMCTSPLVSLLCFKFSKRKVTICGGVLTSIAMFMTSFPVSLPYLYFTYGVLAAFGFNMVLTPCFVIIGEYFRKRRARAMSIAMLGGSLGGVSLPPLLNFLFSHYGYLGTMLILSGLVLNLCVGGALFRSLDDETARKTKARRLIQKRRTPENESDPHRANSVVEAGRRPDPGTTVPDIVVQADDDGRPAASEPEPDGDPDSSARPPRRRSRQVSFQIEGAIVLPTSAPPPPPPDGRKPPRRQGALRRWCGALLRTVGAPLFGRPRFLSYALLMLGSVLSLSVSGVFLSGLVADVGLRPRHAGLLLAAGAAVDVPGKLLSGVVFDLGPVRPYRSLLLAALGFLTGLCSLAMAFAAGLAELFAVYALYAFFASAYHTQHATVLADIVGSQHLSPAMGLCRLAQGIGFVLGPTLGGHIRDVTGLYRSAYVFSGCVLLASTACYTAVDAVLLWKRKRKEESDLELSDGHVARYRHDSISTLT